MSRAFFSLRNARPFWRIERGMTTSDSPIAVLNRAIEMCRNGEQGFAQAASAVKDAHLRKALGQYSEQRAQFGLQLQALVKKSGGEPETHGSAAGALHRSWMGLKAAITGGNESTILDECARGDDTALETYRELLAQDVPSDVRDILLSQRLQIEEVRGKLAELRAHLEIRPALS
jgi:uncharacterized protein (TIGR02284 family)